MSLASSMSAGETQDLPLAVSNWQALHYSQLPRSYSCPSVLQAIPDSPHDLKNPWSTHQVQHQSQEHDAHQHRTLPSQPGSMGLTHGGVFMDATGDPIVPNQATGPGALARDHLHTVNASLFAKSVDPGYSPENTPPRRFRTCHEPDGQHEAHRRSQEGIPHIQLPGASQTSSLGAPSDPGYLVLKEDPDLEPRPCFEFSRSFMPQEDHTGRMIAPELPSQQFTPPRMLSAFESTPLCLAPAPRPGYTRLDRVELLDLKHPRDAVFWNDTFTPKKDLYTLDTEYITSPLGSSYSNGPSPFGPGKREAIEQHGLQTPPLSARPPHSHFGMIFAEDRNVNTDMFTAPFLQPVPIRRPFQPHRSPLPCKVEGCNKTFVSTWNLSEHLKTHDKDRPKLHTCDVQGCGKAYFHRRDLRRHHIKIHSKSRRAPRSASVPKSEIILSWMHSQIQPQRSQNVFSDSQTYRQAPQPFQ